MKISLKWLSEYIDVSEFFSKPQELSALLTAAGLEVESIQNLAKTYSYVVVGHILEKGKHPNADRLSLCQVSTGEGKIHQIVCGAQNHKTGDNVVVALPGAVLPGDFSIKHSKIRGVDSGGMLCSTKELGLPGDADGIMILPAEAPIGKPFAEYMGLDDILLELKVTPNRADCLSHLGLARELACLLGKELKSPVKTLAESSKSTRSRVQLEVTAPELCPRYDGRLVTGVKVGPSPDWLKKRLEAVGLNSINNVVDVTNFVMIELGQPLHAFDLREIKGGKIVVARANKGEPFVSFDGTEVKLEGDELTIRDGERAVALAGIVGGKNSGIQDDTTEVFIEAAYFAPSAVRKTMRRFGINTDSGYRFSRGTNPEAVPVAMNRAAELIQQVAGGEIWGDPHDFYPQPIHKSPIAINVATVSARLGYEVTEEKFGEWMKRLGCDVTKDPATAGQFLVKPPIYRVDLAIDMDLVEEYARLHGYQHIPETLPVADLWPSHHDWLFIQERKVRRLMQGQGYLQALNYSFTSRKFQEQVLGSTERLKELGLRVSSEPVMLLNPLNEDINAMRMSLLPGLLKNVMHNSRHGNKEGRLYEMGLTHFNDGEKFAQEPRIAMAIWGDKEGLWQGSQAPQVFQLKAVVENLLRSLVVQKVRWATMPEPKNVPEFLHPGQAAELEVDGKVVGFIGTLHPVLQDELKIRETVAVAEFNLEKLLVGQPRTPKFRSIPAFPAVDRDIAFVMPKELAAGEIEKLIRETAGELLREVSVFDVFEGGTLSAGQKSVAYRLLFQDLQGTLEDASVNELRDRVVNAVKEKFSISVR